MKIPRISKLFSLLHNNKTREDRTNWWNRFKELISETRKFLKEDIWYLELDSLSRPKAIAIRILQIFIFLIRQLSEDKLLVRASAITYSTLLGIVPFLAVIFSILKGFGLHMNVSPFLADFLSPLGPRGDKIAADILEFVDKSQTGTLGIVSFALLMFTVFNILNSIESSYNDIWNVHRMRNLLRRISAYTFLVIVGPILLFIILTSTAFLTSIESIKEIIPFEFFVSFIEIGVKFVPYILSCFMFILGIWFIPYVEVKFKAALVGGILSGFLWQLLNWGFSEFIVGISRTDIHVVLFAGFATLPMFLLWIFIGWNIALIGAELGYVVQYVGVMRWREFEKRYGDTLRRFIGVRVVLEIVRDFSEGEEVPGLEELSNRLQVPETAISDILQPLLEAKILMHSSDEEEYFLPAKSPDNITIADLLIAFRGTKSVPKELFAQDEFGEQVENLLREIDASMKEGKGNLSLRDACCVLHVA